MTGPRHPLVEHRAGEAQRCQQQTPPSRQPAPPRSDILRHWMEQHGNQSGHGEERNQQRQQHDPVEQQITKISGAKRPSVHRKQAGTGSQVVAEVAQIEDRVRLGFSL